MHPELVDVDLLLCSRRQRAVALAKSILCGLAHDHLMLSNTNIDGRLKLTPSAVSKLVSRGRLEPEAGKLANELPVIK